MNTNIEDAIKKGLRTGIIISARFTPEISEKIKKESKEEIIKLPTYEQQIEMVDAKIEPDYIIYY